MDERLNHDRLAGLNAASRLVVFIGALVLATALGLAWSLSQ